MTTQEAKQAASQAASKHWGAILAAAGAALYYGVSFWYGSVPDEAKVTAITASVVGIARWLAAQNKTDTTAAIKENVDFEKLLAALGVRERFKELEQKQEIHHQENSTKLEMILNRSVENDRLHAEHISVTDSLAGAVGLLVEEVIERKPEFSRPEIFQRKRRPGAEG